MTLLARRRQTKAGRSDRNVAAACFGLWIELRRLARGLRLPLDQTADEPNERLDLTAQLTATLEHGFEQSLDVAVA